MLFAYSKSISITSSASQTWLSRQLEQNGIAFVNGVRSETDALELASWLGQVFPHRDSEPTGLTRLVSKPDLAERPGFRGFSPKELFPHTDRSCISVPPTYVVTVCSHQSDDGGHSTFVDGQELLRVLGLNFPDLLDELSRPNSVMFDDFECRHVGAIFERQNDGQRMMVRYRNDSCIFFSGPLAKRIPQFENIILSLLATIRLRDGEGYVVDNHRWLHGRTTFCGHREMWRVLVGAPSNRSSGLKCAELGTAATLALEDESPASKEISI